MIAMIQTSDLQAANCLKLRNDFNAVVKIDFIRYGYNVVQLPSVCPNTRPGEAFVLISEKALNYAEMESCTSDIPTPDPYSEDRLLIESVFSNVPNPSLAYMPAGTSPYQTFQYPGFPWPTMSGTQPAENTAGWASKNWFNCGGGFAEDNAPFPAPTY
jgi:hypothetical protein